MIRLQIALELDYQIAQPGSDFIFNIHAALTARQRVLNESLTLSQSNSSCFIRSRIRSSNGLGLFPVPDLPMCPWAEERRRRVRTMRLGNTG